MKVVGEEGTSIEDFIIYLKAELLDDVYLQQNGFDKVDAATGLSRQKYVFSKISSILATQFLFERKELARRTFYQLRQLLIDWNYKKWESEEFKSQEKAIDDFLSKHAAQPESVKES